MKRIVKRMLKVVGIALLSIILLVVLVPVTGRIINACKNRITGENGIQESTYIDVNGIKQYIQIRGEDVSNPIMIFIHGGPAGPMGYVSAYYQKFLEEDLTIINYDQRGCGRTYFANDADSTTNVELLIEDLNGIVEYAKERFGQEKVIIAGHSWGTILGTLYTQQYPENVQCYIGISQMTNGYQNKITNIEKVLEREDIKGTEDEKQLQELLERMKKVSTYEEMSIDDVNSSVNLVAKYLRGKDEMSGLGQIWQGIISPDMNLTDIKWFMKQTDTAKFLEDNKELMDYALFGFDISEISHIYQVPVYYIAGTGDYMINQDDVKDYYETIQAPDKNLFEFENVGHSMFMDDPKLFGDTVKELLDK